MCGGHAKVYVQGVSPCATRVKNNQLRMAQDLAMREETGKECYIITKLYFSKALSGSGCALGFRKRWIYKFLH